SALHGRSDEPLNQFKQVNRCFTCSSLNCTLDRACNVIFIA
uniref:Uncharacterized protein n=1 Tax=Aegilops tauschii subsp. strangulata TaxID=200361 RepID=A0A453AKW3_AEGTS